MAVAAGSATALARFVLVLEALPSPVRSGERERFVEHDAVLVVLSGERMGGTWSGGGRDASGRRLRVAMGDQEGRYKIVVWCFRLEKLQASSR